MLSVLLSLSLGSYRGVGAEELFKMLLGEPLTPVECAVLTRRSIRTLAAAVAGLGLGLSGAGLQYVLRNPLADPYLLGLASGAALGVLIGVLIGRCDPYSLFTLAFAGALATFFLVFALSMLAGMSALAVIVTGITVSYVVSAVNTVLVLALGEKVYGTFLWLFGSVAYALKERVIQSILLVSIAGCWLIIRSRAINTLILGEEVASSLGVNVKSIRTEVVVLSALATAGIVAFAGPIGFLGLAAPWVARLAVGSDFRRLVLMTMVSGPLISILSDVVARVMLTPQEVPLTAVTSVVGAPVLLYLMIRRRVWG
ncbi:MAG: iron ABC transporter permease [Thermoprotei archaeon]|nr:MAG: iron ABC transporter permease [Thermoprotei archaeon]